MYKQLQLSTTGNTVKKSTTGIPKSTLKLNLPLNLNFPLNIKLPTNVAPQAKKTILKAPSNISLKKIVTFENLMATLPSNTTDNTTEKRSQSNQIMNNSLNPNTAQTPGVMSASTLLKNMDNQINPSIVQSNLIHLTPTSSPQVTENNVTKPVGSFTVQHHQVTHQKATEDNIKPCTSQGTNVIVISDEDESQFDDIIITKLEKSDFLYQFFPLSNNSREEIRPLVEINHIESDCMSEYDKIGWNCVGAPRQLKLIKGDGNCYFRAISYAISEVKYEIIGYVGYRNQNHGNSQNVLKGYLHMV